MTDAEKWKLIEPYALKLAELDRHITEVVEATPYYQSRHEDLFNEQRRWRRDVLRLLPCVATGDAEGISRFEPPVAEKGVRA